MQRRGFLAATGLAFATALAGCTDDAGTGMADATTTTDGAAATTSGDAGDTTTTPAADGASIDGHPAAAGLADQPVLGDLGGNVVIAFEDPSCPRCRAFETGTVPQIRSDLVEPGHAAFVSRGYPVIYPWGKPATQALEATFARSADAFWALNRYYYENQRRFDTDNVLSLTASFLTEETAVDGDAVASDAASGAFDAMVQADLDAGEAAGVGGTTPTIFLFRDGRYVTKAAGSISYDIVATALGVP